jgi:hypothetical protein
MRLRQPLLAVFAALPAVAVAALRALERRERALQELAVLVAVVVELALPAPEGLAPLVALRELAVVEGPVAAAAVVRAERAPVAIILPVRGLAVARRVVVERALRAPVAVVRGAAALPRGQRPAKWVKAYIRSAPDTVFWRSSSRITL